VSTIINGQLFVAPTVVVTIDDSALAGITPLGSGAIAILGECLGGPPDTALRFTDPGSAVRTLGSGRLVDAVRRAFATGPDIPGSPTVYAIRVNPGMQSKLDLPAGTVAALGPPARPTLTESDTGGFLQPGTYNYRITALNANGETTPSPEATVVATVGAGVTTGSVLVVWPPMAGASGYRVYGRTPAGELFIAESPVATFTDTGSITPSGALPGVDTTGGAASAVTLTSVDYGAQTRQIRVQVQNSPSGVGLQISTDYQSQTNTKSSIYRRAIAVKELDPTYATTPSYTAATLDISGMELTIVLTPTGGGTSTFTVDLTVHTTVQSVIDAINNFGYGLQAALTNVNPSDPSTFLDEVPATSIYSTNPAAAATDFYANHQAVLDYFNQSAGYVTATLGNVRKVPANTSGWVYLGSDSVAHQGNDYGVDSFGVPKSASTIQDWSNAMDTSLTVNVSVVTVVTPDSTIQGMLLTNVDYASSDAIQKERVMVAGGDVGESVNTVISRADGLRDPRCMYVYPGIVDTDPILAYSGQQISIPPFVLASQLGGMLCGGTTSDPLTHRYISAAGVERVLTPADIATLLEAGIAPIEGVTNRGYRVVHSISTWIATTNYRLNEISIMRTVDQIVKDIRRTVDDRLIGRIIDQDLLTSAVSLANSVLRSEQQNGLVLSYSGVRATNITTPDTVQIEFTAEIAIPANYIQITAHLTPFQGTATG
jgi:hypothetical protein